MKHDSCRRVMITGVYRRHITPYVNLTVTPPVTTATAYIYIYTNTYEYMDINTYISKTSLSRPTMGPTLSPFRGGGRLREFEYRYGRAFGTEIMRSI